MYLGFRNFRVLTLTLGGRISGGHKFCMVVTKIFSIIIAFSTFTCKNLHKFTFIEQTSPDNRGPPVRPEFWIFTMGLLYVTHLAPKTLEEAPVFVENLWIPVLVL